MIFKPKRSKNFFLQLSKYSEVFDDFSKDRLTFRVTSKQIVRRDLLRKIDRINYEEKEKIIFCNLFY